MVSSRFLLNFRDPVPRPLPRHAWTLKIILTFRVSTFRASRHHAVAYLAEELRGNKTRAAFKPALPLKSGLPRKSHPSRLVSAAKKQEIQQKVSKWSLPSFLKPKQKEPELPAPEPKWGVLNWAAYNQAWQVPWGRKELAIGLLSWAISFVAVGIVLVPIIGFAAGVKDFKSLTSTDKSFYALVNQVIETIVGIAVINAAVSRAGPLEDEIFKLDFRAPLNKPNGWLFWGILGVVAAPVVVGACATLVSAVGYEDLVTDKRGTVDGVAQMLNVDLGTFASLFSVTAILAPLLEETVFRGFLLTSLTKFMPTWLAVLISSLGFGAAHASARDLPQLAALGTLLGFSYVRSRNLLTPMLIHGAWNGTVLVALFTLASSGVDLQEVLSAQSGVVDFVNLQHLLLP
ncbi:hypothetical protein WJX79_008046 [Trebouxia sp. C0005]